MEHKCAVGPSVVTVERLITAVHLGLVVALALLVALRPWGFRGLAAEFGGVVLTVLAALLIVGWRGRGSRA